jgi:hypothetical protein
MPRSFTDALSYCVRYLIRTAYNMPANSVRPANQALPVGKEAVEFAMVGILTADSDFGTFSLSYDPVLDDGEPTEQVTENLDNVYRFTTSIQFFRHTDPAVDTAGLSPFGLGAFDKAARLGVLLASAPMMDLQQQMGIGIEAMSPARNLSALVDGAIWEDRGSVDVTFVVVNRESVLLANVATAEVGLNVAEPGQPTPDTRTIEVNP